jgi:hypothetical protein
METVVDKAGYEARSVALAFSETGMRVIALKELAAAKAAPAAKKKRPGNDDYEWKEIYVRPGEGAKK